MELRLTGISKELIIRLQAIEEGEAQSEKNMSDVKVHRNMAKLANVDIFYRDTKTEGPAILCLHGRWGRGETWMDFIHRYGGTYRVIAPDQRGHGLSGKPLTEYTAEEMATDMIELLRFLGLDSIILVGHSMGGRIAGYLAALNPTFVKALAILDKSASGSAQFGAASALTVDPLTRDWPMPFTSLTEAQAFLRQAMESELAYAYFMNSLVETVDGYQMMFSSQAMVSNIANDQNWFHLLPKIGCPVLLVRSSSHEAVTDEDLAKMRSLIADCTSCEMSKPDHNVHLSDTAEFYGYFDAFLKKLQAKKVLSTTT